MGLFLSMSSVVESEEADVVRSLSSYAADRRGVYEPTSGDIAEDQESRIAHGPAGHTVLYPAGFSDWDEVSAKLSADLRTTVFSFHIHDGDLWMFIVYRDGEEVLKFNSIPDYFSEERADWLPTPAQVAQFLPNVDPKRLAPYLRHWPEEGIEGKAHPEDESEYEDWQVVDFMRELGFVYPDVSVGRSYRMKVKRRR